MCVRLEYASVHACVNIYRQITTDDDKVTELGTGGKDRQNKRPTCGRRGDQEEDMNGKCCKSGETRGGTCPSIGFITFKCQSNRYRR